jgi:hypothetical protein
MEIGELGHPGLLAARLAKLVVKQELAFVTALLLRPTEHLVLATQLNLKLATHKPVHHQVSMFQNLLTLLLIYFIQTSLHI